MASRHRTLEDPPLLFAHRGGRAHAPENTTDAFALAVRLGATGLEGDVWLSSDGIPILDHDGRVGPWYRRRRVADVRHADLPGHLATLDDMYRAAGTGVAVSLDLKDPAAAGPVIEVARRHGAASRLWICHPDHQLVAGWRELDRSVRLVDSTRLIDIEEGPERRAADLAAAGVDAINLPEPDWTGGLTTLSHRFGIRCLGWNAQHPRQLDRLLALGIDGVFSDHVDRMVDALGRR